MSLAALTIAALTAALTAAAPAASGATSPYLLAWTGDAAAARSALTDRLPPGALPDDGEGLLVLACLELEGGRLDVAERAAARLAALEPRKGDGRVLVALVARRRASPREPMFDALAEAWKTAGRPDLGKGGALARLAGPVLATGSLPPAPGADLLARLTPEEAFLLGGLDGPRRPVSAEAMRLAREGTWLEARRARAKALAGRPPPRPVALDLAAFGLLGAGREREQVRAALAKALPDEGYFAIAAVAGPPMDRGPLAGTEVAALEKAVARPRLTPPRVPLHEALLAAAARLDAKLAPAFAREALGTVTPRPTALAALGGRALATTDPALRARAGQALERAAATLRRDPTVDGRQLGALLARSAAELRGDAAAGKALLDRFEAWRVQVVAADLALAEGRWPLPSLRREWRPEQDVARAERLVGPVPE
jgi:hypothetical protein